MPFLSIRSLEHTFERGVLFLSPDAEARILGAQAIVPKRKDPRPMNRRDALFTSSAMVVSASLGAIACGGRNALAGAPGTPHAPTDGSLTDAAYDCLKKGDACVAHCVMLLGSGDTSMAGCAAAVHDMVA